jgi:SOS-response transcriptional repressor LexA
LKPLTKKQQEVLLFITEFRATNPYAPTLQEIGDAFGQNRSVAKYFVDQLVAKGALVYAPGLHRSIVVVK